MHSYVKQYNFNNIKILSSLTLFKHILPFIFYFLYFACKVRWEEGGLLSPDLNSIIKTFFISFFFIREFEMKTSQPKRRLTLSMRKQEIFIFSVSVCLGSLMRHDKQNIHRMSKTFIQLFQPNTNISVFWCIIKHMRSRAGVPKLGYSRTFRAVCDC